MPARSHLPCTYLYNKEFSWIPLIRSFELRHLEQIVSFFFQDLETLLVEHFIYSFLQRSITRKLEIMIFLLLLLLRYHYFKYLIYKSDMQKCFKSIDSPILLAYASIKIYYLHKCSLHNISLQQLIQFFDIIARFTIYENKFKI